MRVQGTDKTDELENWDNIKKLFEDSAILIGNGASLAIWNGFQYSSLFQKAASNSIQNPLLPEDVALFSSLGTENFERALGALATARMICPLFGLDVTRIGASYERIRNAMAEAVKVVHVPWGAITGEKLKSIRSALLPYEVIYSTNYDLLLYWAIMTEGDDKFKDYLWAGSFDLANTEVWPSTTIKVFYLHGGLHLYRFASGQTVKRKAEFGMNLLDLFGTPFDEALPLIVTEGTSKDKLATINNSNYLSFVYSQFADHDRPLVIFGQSLGQTDEHLTNCIKSWGAVRVAISIKCESPKQVLLRKQELRSLLPNAILFFYDATTHPLGYTSLKVDPPENILL